MRRTISTLAAVTAFGITACMGGEQEPEPAAPQPTTTAGMEDMDQRAGEMRDQYAEPQPQYGELDSEPMEPPTYGEMQREPGEMDPQYGATQPPMGGETPPPTYGEMPTDETGDMSARIEDALRTTPSLEDDSIAVRVEGSRVHLAGLVDSPTEVMQARDIARSVPGVQDVDVNELRVVTQR